MPLFCRNLWKSQSFGLASTRNRRAPVPRRRNRSVGIALELIHELRCPVRHHDGWLAPLRPDSSGGRRLTFALGLGLCRRRARRPRAARCDTGRHSSCSSFITQPLPHGTSLRSPRNTGIPGIASVPMASNECWPVCRVCMAKAWAGTDVSRRARCPRGGDRRRLRGVHRAGVEWHGCPTSTRRGRGTGRWGRA